MIPRTILLVDDSDGVRCTLAALLEDDGHRVVEAASLAEARARLDAPIDIAILDLHLPDGRGTDLVPALREAHPTVVIILMSGSDPAASTPDVDLTVAKDRPPHEVIALAEEVRSSRPHNSITAIG